MEKMELLKGCGAYKKTTNWRWKKRYEWTSRNNMEDGKHPGCVI